MECVAACPAENALQLSLPPRRTPTAISQPSGATTARWAHRALRPRVVAAVLALVFFGVIGAARITGHWQTNIPREIYMQLVPNAENYDH
jgi:hypothetical protein